MSGKSDVQRKAFHEACLRAVVARLGPQWAKAELGAESWTACFQRTTTNATQVLRLRLHQRHHLVEVLLGIKQDPTDPMPRVWWEDRVKHPESRAYAKVLWYGDLTYGSEEPIHVPRESWHPEFGMAIEERLAELLDRMESWYATAEAYISTGDT